MFIRVPSKTIGSNLLKTKRIHNKRMYHWVWWVKSRKWLRWTERIVGWEGIVRCWTGFWNICILESDHVYKSHIHKIKQSPWRRRSTSFITSHLVCPARSLYHFFCLSQGDLSHAMTSVKLGSNRALKLFRQRSAVSVVDFVFWLAENRSIAALKRNRLNRN